MFLPTVRAILDVKDHEDLTAFDITEKIKAVVNLGKVRGYKISSDGSSVEPALTPDTAQSAYTLLVNNTALMFPRRLTKDQKCCLDAENYKLLNGRMCGGW